MSFNVNKILPLRILSAEFPEVRFTRSEKNLGFTDPVVSKE